MRVRAARYAGDPQPDPGDRRRTCSATTRTTKQQYSTPEQVRASHILLKTEGKDDAAVKKQAEELLAKVKGGRGLRRAREEVLGGRQPARSRAATSASSRRARWCRSSTRRVRAAARADQRSGQVAVRLSHHQDDRARSRRPSGRSTRCARQIEDQLKSQRAQDEAQRTVNELAGQDDQAGGPRHRRQAARASPSARPTSSRATSRSPGSAWRRRSRARAFELKDGEVSEAVQTPQGYAFITVTGKQDARTPTLDEVKDKVKRGRRQAEGGRDRAPESGGDRRRS